MPVPKPTPGCIWNSFRASGKRHLLLTGGRGSGKTTLLGSLCPEPLPGVTTWADPGKAVYLREENTGRETVIGCFDPTLPGMETKMQPVSRGLQTLGVNALRRCVQHPSPWVQVDEIGYLELTCPEYCQALRQLFEKKQVLAAVRKQDAPFLNELLHRQDVFVVDLDDPYGSAGCVMMASGLGRRFGGSKLLVPFLGKPLLSWALNATNGLFSRRVVVTRNREAAAFCAALGVETGLTVDDIRKAVVRQAQDGDAEAFGRLYDHYVTMVHRYVYHRVGDRSLAEDVTGGLLWVPLVGSSALTAPLALLAVLAAGAAADHG